MDLTIEILRLLGSPYVKGQLNSEIDIEQALYVANLNKIGLMFLLALEDKGELSENLQNILKNEKGRLKEQQTTAARVSKLLNNLKVNYALVKSLYSFPVIPNDVDILLFNDSDYRIVINQMLAYNYELVGGVEAPLEVCLHDKRKIPHGDTMDKDVYDVDIYRELGASYLVYINKKNFQDYIIEKNIKNQKTFVLKKEAEMVVSIAHSFYPEQLYTLMLYYFILSNIKNLDSELFCYISNKNYLNETIKTALGITAGLHNCAHGFVPNDLNYLLKQINGSLKVFRGITPIKYSYLDMLTFLTEKLREKRFKKSFFKQFKKTIISPRMIKYLFDQAIWRYRRETY